MSLLETFLENQPNGGVPSARSVARRFTAWLGSREPTRQVIDSWIKQRQDTGYAAGTVAMEFGIIQQILKASRIQWPYRRGEGPTVGERDQWRHIFTDAAMNALIHVSVPMGPSHAAYMAVVTTYGLRRAEVVELGPHSFNWQDNLVYVETAKHGRQRYHLIPEEIASVLQDHAWGAVSPQRVSAIMAELKLAAGLDVLDYREDGWHAIRRALVRTLGDGGMSESEINRFLRWKARSMAERYASGQMVGPDVGTGVQVIGNRDADLDRKAFGINPWLKTWREEAANG